MSRLAGRRFLKCSYFSEASSPFILYCMSHLLATIAVWLFVAICVIPSDNVMKGHLEMNDASCHSLDLSFSISLCHPLIHLLSFLNLCALWKGSRSNQRVGCLDWGHLCSLYVGSADPMLSQAIRHSTLPVRISSGTPHNHTHNPELNVRQWTTWRSVPFEDFLSFLETLPPAGFMPAGCLPSSGLREVRIHVVSDQLCQSPQVTDPSSEHQPST